MNIVKRVVCIALSVVMCFGGFPVHEVHASASQVTSMYDELTLKVTDATFQYLDEVYLKKYPQLGLHLNYGTKKDKKIIATLAKKITKNCKTNQEKVDEVADWIKHNIKYKTGASAYSIDTFLTRSGNCMSYSELMKDLLRSLKIPTALVTGLYGDMKKAKSCQELAGHAWCFVYVGGKWKLYDATKNYYGLTDKQAISTLFYNESIDGVAMSFDGMDYSRIRMKRSIQYRNGKFWGMEDGKLTKKTAISFTLNNIHCFAEIVQAKKIAEDSSYELGECYRGVITNSSGKFLRYYYENAMLADKTFIQWGNRDYFTSATESFRLFVDENHCYLKDGNLYVKKGYQGPSILFSEMEDFKEQPGFKIIYESSDSNVIEMKSDGTMKAKKNGVASIYARLYKNDVLLVTSYTGFYVGDESRVPDYSDNRVRKSSRNSTTNPLKKKSVTIKSLRSKKKKSFALKWKKLKKAKTYQVICATNKKFTKNKRTLQTKKTSLLVKKLKSKKNYYVKVRGFFKKSGKKYYSKWSKMKRVKVK